MKQRNPPSIRYIALFALPVALGGIFLFTSAAHAATSTVIITQDVTSSRTWTTNNIYVIQNSISINASATLTVASGTIVKVETSSTLITVNGNLNANGVSNNPVFFTAYKDDTGGDTNGDGSSTFPQAGDWDGIEFVAGSSSTLNNAIVRYAGNTTGNINSDLYATGGKLAIVHSIIASSSNNGVRTSGGAVSISSSTLSTNKNYGLYEQNSSGTLAVTTSTFANNAVGSGYIDLSNGAFFTPSGNAASGSSTEGWLIPASTLTVSETLQQDIPYVTNGQLTVNVSSTLTMNPGVILKFSGTSTFLDVKGVLSAQGTSANPIYLTSINDGVGGNTSGSSTLPAKGDWGTIQNEAGASSTISNAIIRYGGSNGGTSGDAEVYQTGGTVTISNTTIASSSHDAFHIATQGHATITSSTITNNAIYGLNVATPIGFLTVATNTFATNATADGNINYGNGDVFVFTASGDADNVTSTGNDRGFVMTGVMATGTTPTWGPDLPYIVNSLTVASGSTFTVNPGVVTKFVQFDGLIVNGVLNVAGTAANPVYFTSLDDNAVDGNTNGNSTTVPAKGDGAYIELNSTNVASTITNAIVRYGGSGAQTYPADVEVDGGTMNLAGATLASSTNFGIKVTSGTGTANYSQFSNNSIGVYQTGGTVNVSSSAFENNGSDGYDNTDNVTSTSYAEYNWWNATSGPGDAATGTGDGVSTHVDFANWLASPPPTSTVSLSLLAFHQYESDATTSIAEGTSTPDSTIALGATIQSSGTSTVKLQVEVEPSSTSFTGTPNSTGSFVPLGNEATATYALFPESWSNGGYHWQARATDQNNNLSGWYKPSSNATGTDFHITTVPLYTQQTSTYPSLSTSTGTGLWATTPYDNGLYTCGPGAEGADIAACGCSITSAVMALRYLGVTTNVSGTNVDPFTLNKWLETTSTGGYLNGNLVWSKIPFYAETTSGVATISTSTLIFATGTPATLSSTVNLYIHEPLYPVIFAESSTPDGGNATTTHFVVGTAFANNANTSTYEIRDSYWYNTQFLNESSSDPTTNRYSNTYSGIIVFLPEAGYGGDDALRPPLSTTPFAAYSATLVYDILSPDQILLTDPNGHRVGQDAAGVSYGEIPHASYMQNGPPTSEMLTTYGSTAGDYTIQVIGGHTGKYSLAYEVFAGNDTAADTTLTGNITAGQVITFTQHFDPSHLASSTLVQN